MAVSYTAAREELTLAVSEKQVWYARIVCDIEEAIEAHVVMPGS